MFGVECAKENDNTSLVNYHHPVGKNLATCQQCTDNIYIY